MAFPPPSSSDDVSVSTSADLTVTIFPSGSYADCITVTGTNKGSIAITGGTSVWSSNVGDVGDGSSEELAGA